MCARLKSDFYVSHAGLSVTQSAAPTQQFAHFSVRLNPTGNGQCQFASVSDQLSTIGVMVSAEELRSNVVSFLKTKPFAGDGSHMQNYIPLDWSVYLTAMSESHTYGDHLTLYAAAKLYGVQFLVTSSIGRSGTRIVSANAADELRLDQPVLLLGHYAETGDSHSLKEHYVSLSWGGATDLTEYIQSLQEDQRSQQQTERHEDKPSAAGQEAVSEPVPSCTVGDVSAAETQNSSRLQWPDIWNATQIDHFTLANDWLFARNGYLGCTICQNATAAGLHRSHRLTISA